MFCESEPSHVPDHYVLCRPNEEWLSNKKGNRIHTDGGGFSRSGWQGASGRVAGTPGVLVGFLLAIANFHDSLGTIAFTY